MVGQSSAVWDLLRDYGVEIRALKKRVEAVTAGDTIRADVISGIIPAANIPVYWWYNGNLLGAGVKADLIAGTGVWISGAFVAGRAYYYIGSYATGGGGGASGTVGWYEHGGLIGYSLDVDFEPGNCVWISGTLVGGRPTYEVGVYPGCLGGAGGISGVDFAANGLPICFGAGLDLQQEWGVWISGSCAGGEATYKVGAYPQAGGTGLSGVSVARDGTDFCFAEGLDFHQGWGIWISGSCAGGQADITIGAYLQPAASGVAGGGDDILALTYAVAF